MPSEYFTASPASVDHDCLKTIGKATLRMLGEKPVKYLNICFL